MNDVDLVKAWISSINKIAEGAAKKLPCYLAQIGVTLASGCKLENDNKNDTH